MYIKQIWIALALLSSGCFSKPGTQGLPCVADGDCDPGQMCIDGLCSASGTETDSASETSSQSTTDEPTTQGSTTEATTTDDSTTEDPTTEDPTTEEPTDTDCDGDDCTTGSIDCHDNVCGTPSADWVMTSNTRISGMAATPNGIYYVAGRYDGPLQLGKEPLSLVGTGVFVARLDPMDGEPTWIRTYPASSAADVAEIDVAGDDVYVGGNYKGVLQGMGFTAQSNGNDDDVFVLRLSPEGTEKAHYELDTPGSQKLTGLAVAPYLGVYLAGIYTSVLPADSEGDAPVAEVERANIFIARLGVHLDSVGWIQGFGDPTRKQNVTSVAVQGGGDIVIAGNYSSPFVLGNLDMPQAVNNGYVVSLDGVNGTTVEWGLTYGDPSGDQYVHSISEVLGSSPECVVAAGQFNGTHDLGGVPIVSQTPLADPLFFRVCSGDGGTVEVAKTFGGEGTDFAGVVAIGSGNRIAVAGGVETTIDLGGGQLSATGIGDGMLVRLNSDGEHVWSTLIGGDNREGLGVYEGVQHIAFTNNGLLVAGSFYQGATLIDLPIEGVSEKPSFYIGHISD